MYDTLNRVLHSCYVKIILGLIVCGILYLGFQDFFTKHSFEHFFELDDNAWMIWITALLSIPNLLIETAKWNSLIKLRFAFRNLYRAVFIGYSAGFITPNRLGEFAGRNTIFPKQFRAELTVSTLTGSTIQGMVTASFGIIAILFHPHLFSVVDRIDSGYLALLAVIFSLSVILLFYKKEALLKFLKNYISAFKSLNSQSFLKALMWATLRYIVIVSQFSLALFFFGFQGDITIALCGISIMYLIQSYIPLTAMGELGTREVLSIFIFGPYMEHSFMAVFPAFAIWMINIAMPALIGVLWLHKSNKTEFAPI